MTKYRIIYKFTDSDEERVWARGTGCELMNLVLANKVCAAYLMPDTRYIAEWKIEEVQMSASSPA